MTTAYERALATSAGKDKPQPQFDLYAVANPSTNSLVHDILNGGPPLDDVAVTDDLAVQSEIADLFDEAKNFADGEPIASAEMADAITKLYDGIHDAGKRADAMRIEEKKPHDDASAGVQLKWKPYVDAKSGKVAMGKSALGVLLTAWRTKVAAEAAAKAEAARLDADKLAAEAQAAIRASAGNLEERERAEEKLALAKEAEGFAKRTEKKATTGTGLRTVWVAQQVNADAALDWAFDRDTDAFMALAQSLADAAVRSGVRTIPGYVVTDSKVAH